MRRPANGTRDKGLIQQAIAQLVNNQAAFVAQLAESNRIYAEAALRSAEAEREGNLRFARIEKELEEIRAVLQRHDRILANLPDAVSRKIGFKPK